MLKAAMLFRDGMVLQRDKLVSIWGMADPETTVSVSVQGKTVQVISDCYGKWMTHIGPFHASVDEEIIICADKERIIIRNVAIGEVWIAGGQSNMEFLMRYDAEMEAEKTDCDRDIRFFDYPEVAYPGQLEEADYEECCGFWRRCSPEALERFSAVAYYFAKSIGQELNIPIGIIGCNWGGTPACAWMSEDAIVACGGSAWLEGYRASIADLDIQEYVKDFRSNRWNYKTDFVSDPMNDILLKGYTTEQILYKVAEIGFTDALTPPMGPFSERRPTGLYESMLKQVAPYGVRGVLWYQGEADDERAEIYDRIFPALIRCWRELWNEELPFLFVQLAPFAHWLGCRGTRYPEIRAAQQWTADHVPNTAMAVITDAGVEWDIHPKHKRPVGERLARLAQHYVYGEDVACEAPRMKSIAVSDGQVCISFAHAGEGLYLDGDCLDSLELFQAGYPLSDLSCRAEGDTLIVKSSGIHAGLPTQARLAWRDYYEVHLTNSTGLPARPAIVSANIAQHDLLR